MAATEQFQDFVPVDEWPTVATMLEGFGDQTLPASTALAGTTVSLHAEDGREFRFVFHDGSSLAWTTAGTGADQEVDASYKAIEARNGIFIIDIIHGENRAMQHTTIVFNRNTGVATIAVSRFVDEDGRTRAATEFIHAKTESAAGGLHQRSSGLVGKRIYYRYSDVESYEHIYLNPGTFVWHCIRGGEKGLADVERSMVFDIDQDLFLFFWTEKVMTVEAVLLVDLREQRSIGRMFGWDDSTDAPVVLPFNSRLSVLNTTGYPQDHNKH
ncbi:MoaF C-terminal domain-containing protein [Arthrobacter mobilis]|uniref:Molybdenum cofactor biosynthesis protein F n=1 Tax=Arthrobacter mobilis TaxID=2724944 RepID=A0A7X6HBJ5_9MICC|nr:MoaF C-terminal domain-containing protein [Arthrobacter mobilis]NKX53118.1 hypothetical protein [Arthrobacter mobilis]